MPFDTLAVLGISAATLLPIAGLLRWRAMRNGALQDLAEMLDDRSPYLLDEQARLCGKGPYAAWWSRGFGCLALNRKGIIFIRWSPRRTLYIPVDRIIAVEGTPPRHRHLRVTYHQAGGGREIATWKVRNLGEWLEQLGGR